MRSLIVIMTALCASVSLFAQPIVNFKNDTQNPYPCEEFRYGKDKDDIAEIYCVSHGSIVIKVPGCCLFLDPVMRLGDSVHQYGCFKTPGDKAVLLTHEHPDHLSKETIDYLSENEDSGSFHVYGNRKCIEQLGRGVILENGDTASIIFGFKSDRKFMKITAVPAYNTTKDHLKFHPEGNGNGYLIEIGDLVIYVAGDTEPIPEMKHLGKIDVAFLPVNQPYTMTPKQCIKAAKAIKPAVLIPYHMGETDMSPVTKAFENSAIRVIVHEELR